MRLRRAIRRAGAVLLLPLSTVPLFGVTPVILESHERFVRQHDMAPLPAPAAGLTHAERKRYEPFRAPERRVPVLAWRGIGGARDGFSTSQRAFARQLALLERLGYTAIGTRQWASFRAGRASALPRKPILLTFDGGRLDSYRGADRVLQRFGMRAAIFVITGEIEDGDPFYATWEELHRMRESGRWDVEPHAHEGHTRLTISPDGRQAPFYAARRYTRSQGKETLAEWEARVSSDLFDLREVFADQGIEPHAFALPYGDFGQRTGDDPEIPRLLRGLLVRQFGSFFVHADGDDPAFTRPGSGSAERYQLRTGTTLDDLYAWLRRHSVRDDDKG